MLTAEENRQLNYLTNKKNRFLDNCISCVHYRAGEPCWEENNPEVQNWLNANGKYKDLKLACPEWYDEW